MAEGHIVVLGAPAPAGFCAALWAAAGHMVTWIAPPDWHAADLRDGVHLTDHSGLDARVSADTLACTTSPEILSEAAMIVVLSATPEACALLRAAGTKPGTAPASRGAAAAPVLLFHAGPAVSMADGPSDPRPSSGQSVEGVLPWQVEVRQQAGPRRLHRCGSGPLLVSEAAGAIARELDVPCLETTTHRDIPGLLWGLRLAELLRINAGKAEAPDLPEHPQALLQEALGTLAQAGIRPCLPGGLPFALRVGLWRSRLLPASWRDGLARPHWPGPLGDQRAAAIETMLAQLLRMGRRHGIEMPETSAWIDRRRQGAPLAAER